MAEITTDQDVQRHETPLVAETLQRLVAQAMDDEGTGGAWLNPRDHEDENRLAGTEWSEDMRDHFLVITDTGMRYAVEVTPLREVPCSAQRVHDAHAYRTGREARYCPGL